MRKKYVKRVENIIKEYTGDLTLFAMYFLHDPVAGKFVVKESLISFMDKLRKEKIHLKEGGEKVFLLKCIREKCAGILSGRGEKMQCCGKFPPLPDFFDMLEEEEREIMLLHNFLTLDFTQCGMILDRKDAEELYFLAMMKLSSLERQQDQKEGISEAEKIVELEKKQTEFFQTKKKMIPPDPLTEEELLAYANMAEPFDYKRALIKAICILLFCVLTLFIFMYSTYRSKPELQVEVRVGVLMDKEELKANLLKEKARQEKLKKEMRKKKVRKVRIRAINLEGVRKIEKMDGKTAEKILKERTGLEIKVWKAEFTGEKREWVWLYVSAGDSVKLLRSDRIIK